MTLENLINHKGKPVRCLIYSTIIDDCILHLCEGSNKYYFYLCQNHCNGADSDDKYHYKYSWMFIINKKNAELNFEEELQRSLAEEVIKDLELL